MASIARSVCHHCVRYKLLNICGYRTALQDEFGLKQLIMKDIRIFAFVRHTYHDLTRSRTITYSPDLMTARQPEATAELSNDRGSGST